MSNDSTPPAPMPIGNEEAEELVTAYGAGENEIGQSGEEKAAGMMTDDFLVRTYERTSGKPGDPEADALSAEIERRGLDV